MEDNIAGNQSVLVIDDEPAMLQLLKRVFESEGYQVRLAADGVYGLLMLREAEPALVLLDIVMPGPDGYEVVARIRQVSNVPIIMVTAKCEEESVAKALEIGADGYVRKPFSPAELVAQVRAKLRRAALSVSGDQTAKAPLYLGEEAPAVNLQTGGNDAETT